MRASYEGLHIHPVTLFFVVDFIGDKRILYKEYINNLSRNSSVKEKPKKVFSLLGDYDECVLKQEQEDEIMARIEYLENLDQQQITSFDDIDLNVEGFRVRGSFVDYESIEKQKDLYCSLKDKIISLFRMYCLDYNFFFNNLKRGMKNEQTKT